MTGLLRCEKCKNTFWEIQISGEKFGYFSLSHNFS